ncbi:MAG: hypothetical protein OEW35_12140 [Gammaproteobacteria bacterium]|nr:hypothetical protein [Gammaproteobacteria bacterium]MDH5310228.1 hypothetical protein [Gammaproteobacteria bacterium]
MPPSVVRFAQPDPPASQRWSGIVLALLVALLGGLALGGCANFNKATCKLCPGPVLEGEGNAALPFGSELRGLAIEGRR